MTPGLLALTIALGLGLARPAAAAPSRVVVRGGSGDVLVTASAQAKEVTGSGRIAATGDTVQVQGTTPDERLTLTVPAAVSLSVVTWSGKIEVRGVRGELELRSVSGDLVVSGPPRGLSARTVSGAVRAEVAGKARVRSVNGAVSLRGSLADVEVTSVSGKVTLAGFSGGSVSTTSGGLSVEGTLGKGSTARLRAHSGDVGVKLRAPAGVSYALRSFSGALRLSLGGKSSSADQRAEGSWEGGGARLDCSTFSGAVQVELRR